MKNICILTTGVLPVPATKGGAVEGLTELLLEQNERDFRNKFAVISIFDENALIQSKKFNYTHFLFIENSKIVNILDRFISNVTTLLLRKKSSLFNSIFSRLTFLRKTRKILLENNFDYILAENNHSLFLVLKNKRLRKKYLDKFIYHSHNEPYRDLGCKKIIKKIPKIICVSEYIKNCYKNRYSLANDQLAILKNGLRIEDFDRDISENEYLELRKKFGIEKDDFVVVFTGRIIREKGIIKVIEAFQKCNIENKKLLIIGGVFFNTSAKNSVQEEILQMFEENQKPIFTGYINHSELWKYYKISDVAVLPSLLNESALLTNVEAALCKLPIITTNLGGITEYINTESALALPVDNFLVKKIADELMHLYKNKEQRVQNGLSNYSFAKSFSAEKYYTEFCKILEENQ